jgi:hypothetical protein
MKALNAGTLTDKLFQRGCNCLDFVPGIDFAYDSGAKTVTATDKTVYGANDVIRRINVLVHDQFGGTKAGTITVTKGGKGYTSAPTIAFSGGGGSGAAATAVLDASGKVASIVITNAGSSYETAPTVAFSGGSGSGAAAIVTVDGSGVVTAVTLSDGTTGAIDISALNPVKGLAITATVATDGDCRSDGSAHNIGATGSLANWSEPHQSQLAG